jgi:N-carbamoyl-L-amino-acid hydrolase
MRIGPERLLSDLRALATFGKYQTGVDRPAYSPDDMLARQWLSGKFGEAGLSSITDNVGNVYGQMSGTNQAILVGSHTDTVPKGGWLDGSLGVIYGLEIAQQHRRPKPSYFRRYSGGGYSDRRAGHAGRY